MPYEDGHTVGDANARGHLVNKKIVAIIDKASDGALSAYVAHAKSVEQCRRMNLLAARAYLAGRPYEAQSYPAAAWLSEILAAGREPTFVVLEEVPNARHAERRRVAWLHILDRCGVRVPAQEEGFIVGMAETLQERLGALGIALGRETGARPEPCAGAVVESRRFFLDDLRSTLGTVGTAPALTARSPWAEGG